jgi:hypothetical protein
MKLKTSITAIAIVALLLPNQVFAAANLFQQLTQEFRTAFGYIQTIIGIVASIIVVSNGLKLVSKFGDKNHQGDIAKDILFFCLGLVILYFVISNYLSYSNV